MFRPSTSTDNIRNIPVNSPEYLARTLSISARWFTSTVSSLPELHCTWIRESYVSDRRAAYPLTSAPFLVVAIENRRECAEWVQWETAPELRPTSGPRNKTNKCKYSKARGRRGGSGDRGKLTDCVRSGNKLGDCRDGAPNRLVNLYRGRGGTPGLEGVVGSKHPEGCSISIT